MESNATKYEVVNKTTGEVTAVTGMEFGEGYVVAKIGEETVTFNNELKDGNLQHPDFAIREVGTHIEADGTGIVEDIVPAQTNEVA